MIDNFINIIELFTNMFKYLPSYNTLTVLITTVSASYLAISEYNDAIPRPDVIVSSAFGFDENNNPIRPHCQIRLRNKGTKPFYLHSLHIKGKFDSTFKDIDEDILQSRELQEFSKKNNCLSSFNATYLVGNHTIPKIINANSDVSLILIEPKDVVSGSSGEFTYNFREFAEKLGLKVVLKVSRFGIVTEREFSIPNHPICHHCKKLFGKREICDKCKEQIHDEIEHYKEAHKNWPKL